MNIEIGKRYLITSDSWFYAPNGKAYRAAFGTVYGIKTSEETLGVRTNAKSTNWYVEIGRLIIAGCQIHQAVRCDECEFGIIEGFDTATGETKYFSHPSVIFDAD